MDLNNTAQCLNAASIIHRQSKGEARELVKDIRRLMSLKILNIFPTSTAVAATTAIQACVLQLRYHWQNSWWCENIANESKQMIWHMMIIGHFASLQMNWEMCVSFEANRFGGNVKIDVFIHFICALF